MQPTKPLDHYNNIGLTFIEQTGILSLLNNSGIRQITGRSDESLSEMSIAVGLTFEVIQQQIQQIRLEQIQDAQLQAAKAQTDWMLDMSPDEWLQALQRLDVKSGQSINEWISDERISFDESKTS